MNLLKKEIAELLAHYFEMEWSNAQIMKTALQTNSPLNKLLQPNFDEAFTSLMSCVLNGYEIDESDALQEIGLLTHPHFIEESAHYLPTFACYDFRGGDFLGSIWIPYYSKPDYGANVSFSYQKERYHMGNSRIAEIEQAPLWFQTLFSKCRQYVKERNEQIFVGIDARIDAPLLQLKTITTVPPSAHTNHSAFRAITNLGYSVVPPLLKRLEKEEDELFCWLLDDIADFEFQYIAHGEDEKLEQYLEMKQDTTAWRNFFLDWGKRMKWL